MIQYIHLRGSRRRNVCTRVTHTHGDMTLTGKDTNLPLRIILLLGSWARKHSPFVLKKHTDDVI
jgi:hypothetical protein